MAGWIWVVIALVVLICVAVAVWTLVSRRRTERLQDRFGPEYGRTARATGSKRAAEAELAAREVRHDTLDVRALSPDSRRRYASRWEDVQAEFVDSPEDAVAHADELVNEVMSERGYPMEDFEQRVADVSVDHPVVAENYRAAHRIVTAMDSGGASTEDERRAMQHFRALFDDLLSAEGERGIESRATSATAREGAPK